MSPLANLLTAGALLAALLSFPIIVPLILFGGAVVVTLLPALM